MGNGKFICCKCQKEFSWEYLGKVVDFREFDFDREFYICKECSKEEPNTEWIKEINWDTVILPEDLEEILRRGAEEGCQLLEDEEFAKEIEEILRSRER